MWSDKTSKQLHTGYNINNDSEWLTTGWPTASETNVSHCGVRNGISPKLVHKSSLNPTRLPLRKGHIGTPKSQYGQIDNVNSISFNTNDIHCVNFIYYFN